MTVRTRSQKEIDVFALGRLGAEAYDQAQAQQVTQDEISSFFDGIGSSAGLSLPSTSGSGDVDLCVGVSVLGTGLESASASEWPNDLEWLANECPSQATSSSYDFDALFASCMSDFPVAIPPIPTSSISLPPMASTSTLTSCDPSPPSFYSSQSHQQPSSSTPYHSPSPTPSRDSPHPSQSQSQSKSQPGTGGRVDKKRLRSEKRLQVEKRSHLKKRDAGNQLVAYIKENVPQSEAGLVKGVADAATRAIEMMTDLKAHTKLVVSQLADSNTQLALELTRNRELSHRVLSLEALVRQYHMSSRRIPLPVRREEQVQVPKREEDCDGILTSTSSVRGESVKEEDVESKSNVL